MKKRKMRFSKKYVFFLLIIVTAVIGFSTVTTFAMTDDECADLIVKNIGFFQKNDLITKALRWLGWMIIKGMKWISDNSQALYTNTIGLFDFTSYPELESYIQGLKALFTAILAISIVWLGITLIVNHKKRPHILTSLLLAGLTISALSTLMISANEAVAIYCSEVAGETMSDSIINENLYDLYYIDKQYGLETLDCTNSEYMEKCHYPLDKFNIDAIDINDTLDYDADYLSESAKDILSVGVKPLTDGDREITEIYDGLAWSSLFNEFYYRYYINGFIVFITLLSTIVIYLCLSYKVARLIWELPLKRVLAMLYSANITGTQKTMKLLGAIKDSYIIIAFSALEIKIYKLVQTFLANKFTMSGFTYCMLLLFISFAIIDGPNIIQALTGEDAGLQSAFSKVISVYNGTKGKAKGLAGFALGTARHHTTMKQLKNNKSSGSTSSNNLTSQEKSSLSGSETSSGNNQDILKAMNQEDKGADEKTNEEAKNKKQIPEDENRLQGEKNPEQDSLQDGNLDGENNLPETSPEQDGLQDGNLDEENNLPETSPEQDSLQDGEISKMASEEAGITSNETTDDEPVVSDGQNGKKRKNKGLKTFDPSTNGNITSTNEDLKKAMDGKKGKGRVAPNKPDFEPLDQSMNLNRGNDNHLPNTMDERIGSEDNLNNEHNIPLSHENRIDEIRNGEKKDGIDGLRNTRLERDLEKKRDKEDDFNSRENLR